MPLPMSGSKAERQEPFSQRRSSQIGSRGGGPPTEPKSMLSRRPPSDPPPRKPARREPSRPPAAPAPKVSPSSLSVNPESQKAPPPPQEKRGFWSWRPWGSSSAAPAPPVDAPRRLHVLFSLHVHSIQSLPSALDGLRLTVHWNREEEGLQTMPSRVLDGTAEFDEMLRQRCTVFGHRRSNGLMQYDPKLFQLSVVALDVDELELGKHHIDLSRLLPEEYDSGEIGRPADHSWSSSFELSGIAKGSSLFVTFNYDLLHQETSEQKERKKDDAGSMPTSQSTGTITTGIANSNVSKEGFAENVLKKAKLPDTATGKSMSTLEDSSSKSMSTVEDSSSKSMSTLEDSSNRKEAFDSLSNEKEFSLDMDQDLDEEVDLVAGEFLNMLDFGLSPAHPDSEGEQDSPRARLLKQFEYESLFGGELDLAKEPTSRDERTERDPGRGFDSRFGAEELEPSYGPDDGLKFVSMMEASESELQKRGLSARQKSRAQKLEDEETEALMQRWGINENTLHNPPSKPVFGPSRPPSLGKGLGSVLYLEGGGSLRSLNPSSISKNNSSGSLVMQSSKPVVVPSTLGTNAVDVLRHLASLGVETLAKQAMTAMPLQDVTGITDDIAAKGSSHPGRFADTGRRSGYDDYVSLEDLAPLAMPNIEALAVDGLKIQANVAEDEASSYLDAAAWGVIPESTKKGKDSLPLSHDLAAMRFENLHLEDRLSSDVKQSGPLSMALTLEEWSKLDAGIVDDDEKSKENTLAIMAAHNADLQLVKGKGRKQGRMGNTLMIAMLVQLRDPLQNFEAVGAPMLTLVQAERVMLPPKPRMGRNVSVTGNSEVDDELPEAMSQKENAPQFKLTGVHMSGLTTPEDDGRAVKGLDAPKKVWGNQKQIQSGSRWLAAQGMSKSTKPSLLKGKVAPSTTQSTKVKQGETLWSISARVHGSGRKWKELAALNPHIRNPDVIFANETIRTK